MVNYSFLGRGMSNDLRISHRRAVLLTLSIALLFLYVLNKNSCDVKEEANKNEASSLPIIYAVTPTFYRPTQKAELTRLSHLFRLVPNLFWVIVEDADEKSELVRNLINRSGLSQRSVILNVKTKSDMKLANKDPHWSKPRGVEQRNLALTWIRKRIKREPGHGIVYFMDDDNSYSVELFEEMSRIRRGSVGVWGVGLVGALSLEKPIVEDDKVIGFNSMWRPERPFPIDMAGFAISCDLLEANPDAQFSYEVQRGYQESEILRQLTTRDKLQPLGTNQVLVWHTRTESPKMDNELKLAKKNLPASDFGVIV